MKNTDNGSKHGGVASSVSSKNKKKPSASESSVTSVVESSFLPNSRKIYVAGMLHPDIRVPFREITLAPTKTMSGEVEVNEPVRVYDTSGPWGDTSVTLDPVQGLPPLRRDWILKRGDVEEIDGRIVRPIDDGYLSVAHAEHSAKRNGSREQGTGKTPGSRLQAPGKLQTPIPNLQTSPRVSLYARSPAKR